MKLIALSRPDGVVGSSDLQPELRLATKTVLVMRLTLILLTASFCTAAAEGLSQSVTLTKNNASVEEIISAVKQQTGYVFFYYKKTLRNAKKINVAAKNVSIGDFLSLAFKDQPFTFSIEDRTVVLSSANAPDNLIKKNDNSPQDDIYWTLRPDTLIDVSGRVLNDKQEPVAGVSITIKGGAKNTITDDNGNFRLTRVSSTSTLVASCINCEPLEIRVNNRKVLVLTLRIAASNLDEVVVTYSSGYQTISKERSAGSFSKPDMNLVRDRSTSMNILQRLDGLVPGLVINSAPNSQNPYQIRGLTTIGIANGSGTYTGTNRNPLYVVDGIAMEDISSINPQDIADISILKDATAASIWGARASNGVIVITSKKGGNGEKLKVGYNAFVNFQGRPDLDYVPVVNSRQFIETEKEIFDPITNPWETVSTYTNGGISIPPHKVIMYNRYRGLISEAQANKSLDSLSSINNVQQIKDLWYRNAMLMNHTISLSGGGRVHSFYGSLAYTNTQSPRPGEKNNTYKINLRQDLNFSPNVQFYLITDITNTSTSVKRNINIDNRFYPYQLFRDANGKNLAVPAMNGLNDSIRNDFQNRSRINLDYIPLDEVNYGYTKSDALLGRIIAGASIKLLKGLRFEGLYGYVKGNNKTTSYDDAKSYPVRQEVVQFTVAPTPASTPVYYLPTTGGKYSVTNTNQRNWTVRNQLVYDNAWNNRLHQLTLLAGQEAQEQLIISNSSTVRGYNEDLQTYVSLDYTTLATTGVPAPVMANNIGRSVLSTDFFNKNEIQTRFTSYYANAAYTFDKKYSINGSWRIDRSNLFGLDKSAQNRPAWSVGGKWLLSDEKFMTGSGWLDRLAVRATYGISGNSPAPGTASSYDVLVAQSSNFLPGGVGLRIATAANPKLTWETTKTINLGVDFGFLNNRINGSIDVYRKRTENLLGSMPVNGFAGYATIIGNFGDLENKGIELSLSSLNIRSRSFSWNTLFTLSYNKNTITHLNDPTAISTGVQKVRANYVTGFPAFAIFAYPFAGLDNLGDPLIRLADKTVTKARNVAMPDDIVFMGTYQPVWSGGLSNTFRYKGFALSANMIYNLGHVMRRDAISFYSPYSVQGFTGGQIHPDFLNRWKKPGDEAFTNVPAYVSNTSVSDTRRDLNYYTTGDLNVVSASYIKLRDISLSYSLPEYLVRHIKTDNITFRVQLSNIMLWKANKYGIDPEFQDASSGQRVPSAFTPTSIAINNQNFRYGQGAVTIGVNVNF